MLEARLEGCLRTLDFTPRDPVRAQLDLKLRSEPRLVGLKSDLNAALEVREALTPAS
jgi:hypothetical protein